MEWLEQNYISTVHGSSTAITDYVGHDACYMHNEFSQDVIDSDITKRQKWPQWSSYITPQWTSYVTNAQYNETNRSIVAEERLYNNINIYTELYSTIVALPSTTLDFHEHAVRFVYNDLTNPWEMLNYIKTRIIHFLHNTSSLVMHEVEPDMPHIINQSHINETPHNTVTALTIYRAADNWITGKQSAKYLLCHLKDSIYNVVASLQSTTEATLQYAMPWLDYNVTHKNNTCVFDERELTRSQRIAFDYFENPVVMTTTETQRTYHCEIDKSSTVCNQPSATANDLSGAEEHLYSNATTAQCYTSYCGIELEEELEDTEYFYQTKLDFSPYHAAKIKEHAVFAFPIFITTFLEALIPKSLETFGMKARFRSGVTKLGGKVGAAGIINTWGMEASAIINMWEVTNLLECALNPYEWPVPLSTIVGTLSHEISLFTLATIFLSAKVHNNGPKPPMISFTQHIITMLGAWIGGAASDLLSGTEQGDIRILERTINVIGEHFIKTKLPCIVGKEVFAPQLRLMEGLTTNLIHNSKMIWYVLVGTAFTAVRKTFMIGVAEWLAPVVYAKLYDTEPTKTLS